jgi:hypothetical protein
VHEFPTAVNFDSFEVVIINTGAGGNTLTAGDGSTTIVGSAVVATNTSARFRFVMTDVVAHTIIIYRLN